MDPEDVVEDDVAQAPDTSLRDSIADAFDKSVGDEDDAGGGEGPAESKEAVKDDKPRSDDRGTEGKFRKRETAPPDKPEPDGASPEEKPEEKAAKPAVAAAADTKQEPTNIPAPQSWKPALREKWGSVPAEVQNEIHRREREINQGLRDASEARRFANEFYDTIAPFRQFIEADRATPIQAVRNLMQTSATLRVGTPVQKASVAAEIIKNFGVDIGMLDSMLAGEQVSSPMDPVLRQLDQRLAPIHQFMNTVQQNQVQNAQRMEHEVDTDIDTFAQDPKNEFFTDVKETMADLLDVAVKRGQKMDLSTAYNRAIMMHDDIAAVVQERNIKAKADAASSAARAARKKAGLSGSASVEAADRPQNASLRDDITHAIASLSE